VETPKPTMEHRTDTAHIGKSVVIKGELSGSEDLYLDGEVDGSIQLQGHNFAIGPNGRVKADIRAKNVAVHGKVEGNITADRVELKASALHVGNIVTQRIVIEEGAFLKGSVDIQRDQKLETKPEANAPVATAAAVSGADGSAVATTTVGQGSFAESKR